MQHASGGLCGAAAQMAEKLLQAQRLGERSVGAESLRKRQEIMSAARAAAADDENGKLRPALLHFQQGFQPVLVRHEDVEKNGVYRMTPEHLECFHAVGREHDVVSLGLQKSAERSLHEAVIIDDENGLRFGHDSPVKYAISPFPLRIS